MTHSRKWIAIIASSFLILLCAAKPALAKPTWSQWLSEFKHEALADGIEPQFFDQAFRGLRINRNIRGFERNQPEHRLTYLKYRNSRADNFRIKIGRGKFKKNQQLLTEIGDSFGVDPCVIASIWGMETSYGHFMGSFKVIKSLATLAYDSRRSAFFRKELIYALHILQDGHVEPHQFKGEWAGASGHPQFLPSSWHKFAVDYDGDGKKDIWNSLGDVFASIANYLAQNGWQRQQPWSVEVTVPKSIDKAEMNLRIVKPLDKWLQMGVKVKNPHNLPKGNPMTSLVLPYGGPYFLVFKNFKVIMKYNHSIYYAGSIGYMADKICKRWTS